VRCSQRFVCLFGTSDRLVNTVEVFVKKEKNPDPPKNKEKTNDTIKYAEGVAGVGYGRRCWLVVSEEEGINRLEGPFSRFEPFPAQILRKERDLLDRVSRADYEGAYRTLERLCSLVLSRDYAPQLVKMYVIELMVLLSRTAVEQGVDKVKVMDLMLCYMGQIEENNDSAGLCQWFNGVLGDVIKGITYESRKHSKSRIVAASVEFIEKNYQLDLSVEDIAGAVHVSMYHLSRLFKQVKGMTLMEYLAYVRVKAARELLESTGLGIGHIAAEVGYPDPSYFCKVFKKIQGLTPSEYRRRHLLQKLTAGIERREPPSTECCPPPRKRRREAS